MNLSCTFKGTPTSSCSTKGKNDTRQCNKILVKRPVGVLSVSLHKHQAKQNRRQAAEAYY
jgi:hypothetical protein